MIRILYNYIAVLALVMGLSGCTDTPVYNDEPLADAPGTVTLHFQTSLHSRSLDSDNSENRISRIVVGLYPKSTLSDNSRAAVVWTSLEYTTPKAGNTSVVMKLTNDMIQTLFRDTDGAECKFYAVANIPYDVVVPENASIQQLKNLAISSPFDTKPVQDDFVMTAQGMVTYQKPASTAEMGKASGSGSLVRAAAKVRLNLQIPDKIVIKNEDGTVKETWTYPENDKNIRVLIKNGVKESVVDPFGDLAGEIPMLPGRDNDMLSLSPGSDEVDADESKYYSSSLGVDGSFRYLSKRGTGDFPYIMDVPLYTYPNDWEENAEETHKTTLTLIMPWHREGESESQSTTFYYQVPIAPPNEYNPEFNFLERNIAYTINLKVGMLGSLSEDKPMELEASYQIVDWSEEPIEVNLANIRYLVVNPNVYYINNESEFLIPFYTSHPVEISKFEMSYEQFNFPSDNSGHAVDIEVSEEVIAASKTTNPQSTTKNICEYSIVNENGQYYIKINHPMILWVPVNSDGLQVELVHAGTVDNVSAVTDQIVRYVYPLDYTARTKIENAYFPYKFKLSVRHSDEWSFHEEVEVTQYPGMYIEDDFNSGGSYYSFDTQQTLSVAPDYINYGWTFLNPSQDSYNGSMAWKNAGNYGEDVDLSKYSQEEGDKALADYISFSMKGLGSLKKYSEYTEGTIEVTNYNMYVINITQLSDDDKTSYTIGDPRAMFICNDLANETLSANSEDATDWCNPADAVYDGQSKRRLRYYYPTDETSETEMMVAPQLRISSAYGFVLKSNEIVDKCIARRRCATYQERGFPAGRWRLPTYGEMSFICKLSAQKKIPTLFNPQNTYMTAQGAYLVNQDGTLTKNEGNPLYYSIAQSKWIRSSSYSYNVRPVYDEWYWEKIDQGSISDGNGGYIYTLGDMPIVHN